MIKLNEECTKKDKTDKIILYKQQQTYFSRQNLSEKG